MTTRNAPGTQLGISNDEVVARKERTAWLAGRVLAPISAPSLPCEATFNIGPFFLCC